MAAKVYREEIVELCVGEQFEVETYGELKYMPAGSRMVRAIFGCFERTRDGTLLYTSCVEDDWTEHYKDRDDLLMALDAEYLDDLRALRLGNVDVIE